jgi:hypothetical protein
MFRPNTRALSPSELIEAARLYRVPAGTSGNTPPHVARRPCAGTAATALVGTTAAHAPATVASGTGCIEQGVCDAGDSGSRAGT